MLSRSSRGGPPALIAVLGAALAGALAGALACNAPTVPGPTDFTPQTPDTNVPANLPTPTGEAATVQPTPVTLPTSAGPGEGPPARTPAPGEPQFANLRFTTDPGTDVDQRTFAAGTEEIWAVWEYTNMSDGMTVRRVWFQDGEQWIEKEEPWDFAQYGASGTMRDISIYDRDAGLPAGKYSLQLFIDGVSQTPAGAGDFTLSEGGETRVPAPDGQKIAVITPPNTLTLTGDGGSLLISERGPEIIEAAWFPDSRYLLYTVRDRKDAPNGPTFNWTYQIFLYDVQTREDRAFTEPDELGHAPVISPDGRAVAMLLGTMYPDAGFVDLVLGFVTLDENAQRTGFLQAQDFAPIPPESQGQIYPQVGFAVERSAPGTWDDPDTFRTQLNETVDAYPDFEPGVYLLHVQPMTAERVGDLP